MAAVIRKRYVCFPGLAELIGLFLRSCVLTFIVQAYQMSFHPRFHQNFAGCPEGFEEDGRSFWNAISEVAQALGVAMALALDKHPLFFSSQLRASTSTNLRLLHYPPQDASTRGHKFRSGAHIDYCMFTLLMSDGRGLEVRIPGAKEETWVDAHSEEGSIVVNLGHYMKKASNERWQPTTHRVVYPENGAQSESRHSLVSFFFPYSTVDEKYWKREMESAVRTMNGIKSIFGSTTSRSTADSGIGDGPQDMGIVSVPSSNETSYKVGPPGALAPPAPVTASEIPERNAKRHGSFIDGVVTEGFDDTTEHGNDALNTSFSEFGVTPVSRAYDRAFKYAPPTGGF